MKVIKTGGSFNVHDDNLVVLDQLPVGTYEVNFDPRAGYSLVSCECKEVNEKVYGVHTEKVEKILSSFEKFSRNLGVILSGDKGIGKSLTAKLITQRGMELGIPVIIINSYTPGIAGYLASIKQEVIVLFDEFDKTFNSGRSNDMGDPQTEMLTLFDGLTSGKKLFVVTCNDLHNLNDFLVNRPGRFHYHLRFDYPSATEIEQYLKDCIPEEMYGEIEAVVAFSRKVALNYDCLRAIAFELSQGISFDEAITDLNIININRETYVAIAVFEDGSTEKKEVRIDMFDDEPVTLDFDCMIDGKSGYCYAEFAPSDSIYDREKMATIIRSEDIDIDYDMRGLWKKEIEEEWIEKCKKELRLSHIILKRKQAKGIHYNV